MDGKKCIAHNILLSLSLFTSSVIFIFAFWLFKGSADFVLQVTRRWLSLESVSLDESCSSFSFLPLDASMCHKTSASVCLFVMVSDGPWIIPLKVFFGSWFGYDVRSSLGDCNTFNIWNANRLSIRSIIYLMTIASTVYTIHQLSLSLSPSLTSCGAQLIPSCWTIYVYFWI